MQTNNLFYNKYFKIVRNINERHKDIAHPPFPVTGADCFQKYVLEGTIKVDFVNNFTFIQLSSTCHRWVKSTTSYLICEKLASIVTTATRICLLVMSNGKVSYN